MPRPPIPPGLKPILFVVAAIAAWAGGVFALESAGDLGLISPLSMFAPISPDPGEAVDHSYFQLGPKRAEESLYQTRARLAGQSARRWAAGWLVPRAGDGTVAPTPSLPSIVFTILYAWAILLGLALHLEHAGFPGELRSTIRFLGSPPAAFAWVGLGTIAPLAIMILGMMHASSASLGVPPTGPADAIVELVLLQIAHAMLGVILLRGRRLMALGLGAFSILIASWIGFLCALSVLGLNF